MDSDTPDDFDAAMLERLLASSPRDAIKRFSHRFSADQLEDCCLRHPEEMLLYAHNLLNRYQYAFCCRQVPHMAIDCHGSSLDKRLFAEVIKLAPWAALSRALDRLTPSQLDYCIRRAPDHALLDPVLSRMSAGQYDYCVRACPTGALEYTLDSLSEEQLDYCCRRDPLTALLIARHRLTDDQTRSCCRICPDLILSMFGDRAPCDILNYCRRLSPTSALIHSRSLLTDEQVAWCIAKDPWGVLQRIPGILDANRLMAYVADYRLEVRDYIKSNPSHDLVPLLAAHKTALDRKTLTLVKRAMRYHNS